MVKLHNLEIRSPLLLVIETLNKCNLKCSYCYNELKKVEKTKLDFNTFVEIIDEAAEMGIFDINLSGGEPFLHEDILKFVKKVVDSNLGISIVSNGTLIDEKIAMELSDLDVIPYIQISFDSSIPEVHNKTRDNYHLALMGFMNLVEKSEGKEYAPSVGIVVNKYNYLTIPETIEYFSSFTSRFHIMNVMKHPELSLSEDERGVFENIILPKLKEIVEINKVSISILNNKYKKLGVDTFKVQEAHIDCLAGFTSIVVASNLEVYPCDVARYPLGKWNKKGTLKDIYEKSKEMWRGRKNPWCLESDHIKCNC